MFKRFLKSYTAWSFVVIFICVLLIIYGAYSADTNITETAPPYILSLFSMFGFILSILALNRATKKWELFRAWLSLLLSVTLVIILIIFLLFLSVAESFG
ncbi:hypothetical protein F9U64_11130 [Gracilibacillus oryzae]|uniref:Uncharacterized protein n=1 Tax=Gracilibacillus oryzae TaxID=1672701 RepID=A0A7C8GT65_9BACI|nr:hypothetical protein [Gracilibacillus oryzae]KAB8134688.1 hypothetical protein F9U64_11130 [Gracilibacillus oryzae]